MEKEVQKQSVCWGQAVGRAANQNQYKAAPALGGVGVAAAGCVQGPPQGGSTGSDLFYYLMFILQWL